MMDTVERSIVCSKWPMYNKLLLPELLPLQLQLMQLCCSI